jgi:pyruvate/oxaloacetate carboxyltransferase
MAKIFKFPSDAVRVHAKIKKRLAHTIERLPPEIAECVEAGIEEVTSKWVRKFEFNMDVSGLLTPEQQTEIYNRIKEMMDEHVDVMSQMAVEIMTLKAQVCHLEFRLSRNQ